MSSTSSQPDSSGLSVAARAAEVAKIAAELHAAWCERRTLPPLRVSYPWLTIDDAYAISLGFMARRTAAGERIVGKKIGVTSKAVQDMLGVHQPDFGFLTDAMQVDDGGTIVIGERMIQPRAEAEIALVLGSSLKGPGVTEADVLAATASVAACFEIVDSRIDRWDIRIVDTIADNASCGLFVLGAERRSPQGLDLAALEVRVSKNGASLSRGLGSAVQGSPLAAVAWLANTLGAYGVTLDAGDIILSGSLVPLEPARPGDVFELDLDRLGRASVRFA
ncbi:MAG: 2-oxopent-4-enoate hydratase [Gammaproteobacteria bacterium]|jgi:2-oxopent-4-enoate/cis-2-oxohex-4-enoate hydratase|nr:2-oxopent-4-enoate hydratase [Gammaproteobacteria bacterium]